MERQPWTIGRHLAPLRAARAHDRVGRRARARPARAPLRARGLRRPRRHGSLAAHRGDRVDAHPRRSERGAQLHPPRRTRRPRARVRRQLPTEPSSTALAEEHADLQRTADWIEAHGGVAYLAHPYWTGVTPGARAAGERRRDRGLQRRVRARDRARPLRRPLGRAAEAGGSAPRSRATTPTTRRTTRTSRGRGSRLTSDPRTAVLAALAAGTFYSSTGPLHPRRRARRRRVEVRCSPCRSVTLVSGKSTGAAVNMGRLGYRHAGRELAMRRRRTRRPRAARHPSVREARARRGRRRGRKEGVGEPVRGLSRRGRRGRRARRAARSTYSSSAAGSSARRSLPMPRVPASPWRSWTRATSAEPPRARRRSSSTAVFATCGSATSASSARPITNGGC